MRATTKLRFGLLVAASATLLWACVREIVESLKSGVSSLPIGRRGPVFHFSESESPFGFYATVLFFIALALLMLWFVLRQIRALLQPGEAANRKFIHEQIAHMERAAPSGLRPLWAGLAIVAVAVALYLAFTAR